MAKDTSALREQFEEIRDERGTHANTATRIGEAFLALLSFAANAIDEDELKKLFLSKTDADTAEGLITFAQGLAVGDGDYGITAAGAATLLKVLANTIQSISFEGGETNGSGWELTINSDGSSYGEIDKFVVRKKLIANSVEIRQLYYVGGNLLLSPAGSSITRVVPIVYLGDIDGDTSTLEGVEWEEGLTIDGTTYETPHAFRCYYAADDGTTATTNSWVVGDQGKCETYDIKSGVYDNVENHYYWRLVTQVADGYVDLSYSDCDEGSDEPVAGDNIVQEGNRTDTDRMGVIEMITTGEYAPTIRIYTGVNDYSLTGKIQTQLSPNPNVENFITGTIRTQSSSDSVPIPYIVPRGNYDETVEDYTYNNQVYYDGGIWQCIYSEYDEDGNYIAIPAGSTPSYDSVYWMWVGSTETEDVRIATYVDGVEMSCIWMAYGESVTIECKLMRGFKNYSTYPDTWTITRDSGDEAEDAAWLLKDKVQNFDGSIELCYNADENDLAADTTVVSTTFTITASKGDETLATTEITI